MCGMARDPSLTGDEQPVLLLHPHWKTLIGPLLLAVIVLVAALLVEAVIPAGKAAGVERLVVAAIAILALMLWLMVPVLRWRTTTYQLTTRRLRVRQGVLTRRGRDIPLVRINDVSFAKGPLDRLLGSGRLVVESAGEHGQIVLRDIPRVEVVHGHAVPPGGGRTAPARTRAAEPALTRLSSRIRYHPVMTDFAELRETIERGGAARYHETAAARGKLFARERIALLTDEGSFSEDGRYANALADGLPADGVVTGTATIDGRPVALMANDSTVKAGSWGARTVEKIIRIIEKALEVAIPMIFLVDSAGARITDQVEMFPGRRGAGRIFHTQIRASGSIPQVCALFGPSAAGGAYIPAFCDFIAMVDGNASMYLGSPRMVEMVVSEKTTLEEMGGARMHCTVSGSGHFLAATEQDALEAVRRYLSYLPPNWEQPPPRPRRRGRRSRSTCARLVPASERQAFDMRAFRPRAGRRGLVLRDPRAVGREVVTGFARLDGQVIGVIANNPMFKGGVLFVDSADKAARFIQICDAFGDPAAVPGGRARLHGRHRRRAAGHHQARREDDRRDVAMPPCRRSAWWCARPTAPACTRWPGPASSRTRRWRCRPRRSR